MDECPIRVSSNSRLDTDHPKLTGAGLEDRGDHAPCQWYEVFEVIRVCAHEDDGEWTTAEHLLVWEPLVDRDEGVASTHKPLQ